MNTDDDATYTAETHDKQTRIADKRGSIIKKASLIALFGNAILAAIKISAGFIAGSLAVLGDGIDSSTDIAISLMTLLVAGIATRPADASHPWGHGRAETIATSVLAFILFFAGGQLVVQAAKSLIFGKATEVPGTLAIIVTLISIVGKLLLAFSQYYYGKKSGSAMLKANGANMRNDVLISASVLVGLGISLIFHFPPADPIVALLVGLWVIRSAWGIFSETNHELMDGNADKALYSILFEAANSVAGVRNPHKARMRRIAGAWDIDLDIEVDGNLSVKKAHDLACTVERTIHEKIEHVYDVQVHIEPAGLGCEHDDECYGLSETELDE